MAGRSVPANGRIRGVNHRQRIEAAIRGLPTDRIPVALWRHFPEDDQDPARLAARTLEWQAAWDCDLVKFMPSGTYGVEDWGAKTAFRGAANGAREVIEPAIRAAGDWSRLAALDVGCGVLGAQNDALRRVAGALRGSVPILQTVFSPLTTARKLAGERLFEDLREQPETVEHGLRRITATTIEFARAAIAAGAEGLFFATQLATAEALTPAEYERFGCRYDLEIFAALEGAAPLSLLHLHGERVYFDRLSRYPVPMINWHDRITPPALGEGAARFPGAVVGGIEERDAIVRATPQALRAQVRDAVAQTGGRRLIVGPGCVAAIAAPEDNIRAIIDEARSLQ